MGLSLFLLVDRVLSISRGGDRSLSDSPPCVNSPLTKLMRQVQRDSMASRERVTCPCTVYLCAKQTRSASDFLTVNMLMRRACSRLRVLQPRVLNCGRGSLNRVLPWGTERIRRVRLANWGVCLQSTGVCCLSSFSTGKRVHPYAQLGSSNVTPTGMNFSLWILSSIK